MTFAILLRISGELLFEIFFQHLLQFLGFKHIGQLSLARDIIEILESSRIKLLRFNSFLVQEGVNVLHYQVTLKHGQRAHGLAATWLVRTLADHILFGHHIIHRY